MVTQLPPIWVKPNGKSGVLVALREVNLWRQRERAFRSRHATAAAAYARRQQSWWMAEARLSTLLSRRHPLMHAAASPLPVINQAAHAGA